MSSKKSKDMWVYIEQCEGEVLPVSLELCCEVRKLCNEAGEKLAAVYIGELSEAERTKIEECGVDKMIHVTADCEQLSCDALSAIFTALCKKHLPSAVFVGATSSGRDFAPHFAAELETGCTSDATELIFNKETNNIEFVEPAAGGKIMAVITIPVLRPQVGTIRPGTFQYAPSGARKIKTVEENVTVAKEQLRTKVLTYAPNPKDAVSLADAETVVCVGNGLKSAKELEKYRELAKLLGAGLGCTRPLVDKGIMPYSAQIGQSGIAVRPKLYICFGVSGAVNHVTGVHADCLVAVNSDPDAAIFNYCDYGLVGDMDEICLEMITEIKERSSK